MFNKNKLTRFCAENHNLLIQLAYSWCHDRSQAEDLVQDATEKSLRKINQLDDIKKLKSWFIKVMLNCWRDNLRKQIDQCDFDDLIIGETISIYDNNKFYNDSTPESILDNQQLKKSVQYAISQLPLKHKTVVTLIDIYGVNYSEVSLILDIPIGTVMSRLSRARTALLKSLSVIKDTQKIRSIKSI